MQIRTIEQNCPNHGCIARLEITDEDDEDCNAFEALKSFRLIQKGQSPYRCSCGQILKAQLKRNSDSMCVQFGNS